MATKKPVSKKAVKATKPAAKQVKAKAPVKAAVAKPVPEQVSREGSSENYFPQFIGDSFRQRAQRTPL